MTEEELRQYVELWKQTVAVQQHFNDIQWRIRGLAITAVTFTLGAAGVAAREPSKIPIFGGHIGLSQLVVLAGLLLWLSFAFVDVLWYHRFLVGSVKHGEALEDKLREVLPVAGLTHAITESSHVPILKNPRSRFKWRRNPPTMNSKHRLLAFYSVIAVGLAAVALGFGSRAPVAATQVKVPSVAPSSVATATGTATVPHSSLHNWSTTSTP